MKELTINEIEEVSGGNLLGGYIFGAIVDYAISSIKSGSVDYSSIVQSNANYCMVGA